ncbi:MAG: hypothetical protein L3J72_02390 [Thermoplasmata archaeon]|nr:hypothetical protein [Thermoplasmata archaeon]
MATLVLLRGLNVGGKTFRPTAVAEGLRELDVESIGAAGTFVVRKGRSPEQIRRRILALLPFEAEIMVLPGELVSRLLRMNAPRGLPAGEGIRRFLSASTTRIRPSGRLPVLLPGPEDWQVQLTGLVENCALGYCRRSGQRMLYPNEAMERLFGQPFTTRWWETIELAHSKFGRDSAPRGKRPV